MTTIQELAADWDEPVEKLEAQIGEVLFHEYGTGSYEGEGFTLFRDKEGRLMECNGSHCSCYGLEGQWAPELTFKEALRKRDVYLIDKAALQAVVESLPDTIPPGPREGGRE